jgi:hypothetical protein
MNRRSLKIALMAALPALPLLSLPALAQRGGGGGGGGGKVERGDKSADFSTMSGSTIKLSNKDVENISPLRLLIDKRKDLKLTDDQLAKLKDRDDKLKESMKPSFGALDSLRRIATPAGRKPDEGDQARMMDTRRRFTEVITGIRVQYDGAATDAVALLDETQQKQAKDLIEKQRAEADEMVRSKLGGGPGSH